MVTLSERVARAEQRDEDSDRRLANIERGQREIVQLITALRDDVQRSRGHAAAIGGMMSWMKVALGAIAGGVSGAVVSGWRHPIL